MCSAKHGIDVRVFQHALVDHAFARRPAALLGRLEEELDRAGELVAPVHQQRATAEQDRGVGIVPAGVHLAVDCERYSTSFSSWIGRASMSARTSTDPLRALGRCRGSGR